MIYVYFVDKVGNRHSKLFQELRYESIPDEQIYIDDGNGREQLKFLLSVLSSDDVLFVQRIGELADDIQGVLSILKRLESMGVCMYSCEERFLCDDGYVQAFEESIAMAEQLLKRQKSEKYILAEKEHRVGRPRKSKEVNAAIKMLNMGFSPSQSAYANRISPSTLYRAMKNSR